MTLSMLVLAATHSAYAGSVDNVDLGKPVEVESAAVAPADAAPSDAAPSDAAPSDAAVDLEQLLASPTAPVGVLRVALPDAERLEPLTFGLLVRDGDLVLDPPTDPSAYRLAALRKLRSLGLPAFGAEDIGLGLDASDKARFVLAGNLESWRCAGAGSGNRRCEVAVSWSVLDRQGDAEVYSVLTRGTGVQVDRERAYKDALDDALDDAVHRPAFLWIVQHRQPEADGPAGWSQALTLQSCAARTVSLPAQAQQVLPAVVNIQTDDGEGSGVFISPDGWIASAAHVVGEADEVLVTTFDGTELPARVVRANLDRDLALLRVEGRSRPCRPLSNKVPAPGSPLVVIGSPGGSALSHSVSRGVLSAVREHDGVRVVQTDAAVNPGNSGGPMLDARGNVVAVVQWKVSRLGVEGLGFGVPAGDWRTGLGLTLGRHSSATPDTERVGSAAWALPLVEDEEEPLLASTAGLRGQQGEAESDRLDRDGAGSSHGKLVRVSTALIVTSPLLFVGTARLTGSGKAGLMLGATAGLAGAVGLVWAKALPQHQAWTFGPGPGGLGAAIQRSF